MFKGYDVFGIDNINNYYDIELKQLRLKELKRKGIKFLKIDIQNYNDTKSVFNSFEPHVTVNLAAQAGVRFFEIHLNILIAILLDFLIF